MFRVLALSCLLGSTLAAAACAGANVSYWPGFDGWVATRTYPLATTQAKDRYIALNIQLPTAPKARPTAFDSAFQAVCKHHQAKLLKTAKSLAPQTDWRVKVTFAWTVLSKAGVTIHMNAHKYLWLANCRFA